MAPADSELLHPIMFSIPSEPKPDTMLQVFEQPFHFSSTALKMHSAFFRKFLDSQTRLSYQVTLGFSNIDGSHLLIPMERGRLCSIQRASLGCLDLKNYDDMCRCDMFAFQLTPLIY